MAVGKLPINQVNPEQKEKFLAQESGKRRDHLQKFLTACSASQVYDDDDAISFMIATVVFYTILIRVFDDVKVKVDTVLIESDMEAKAILDLIPILNIRKLVLGATKAAVRYTLILQINCKIDLKSQNLAFPIFQKNQV